MPFERLAYHSQHPQPGHHHTCQVTEPWLDLQHVVTAIAEPSGRSTKHQGGIESFSRYFSSLQLLWVTVCVADWDKYLGPHLLGVEGSTWDHQIMVNSNIIAKVNLTFGMFP